MTETEQPQSKYPERIDLSFQRIKTVKSRKTGEDLLVIEAKDPKNGNEYSVWIRNYNLAELLIETGNMIGTIFESRS